MLLNCMLTRCLCRSGPSIDMVPTLKTRNTRICILLGQKNHRMGMLTLHDAERLQAESLTSLCSAAAQCIFHRQQDSMKTACCLLKSCVNMLKLEGSCLQGLQPGTTAGCYPVVPSAINSSPPKDADATKGEVSPKLSILHTPTFGRDR